jgi:hypothetical protein
MPSVSTPDYPVVIENATPALPPVEERTLAIVMPALESWPYWSDIRAVAEKEYGIELDRFDALLPEYQRFLALNMLGYSPVGMFSVGVDKVWHSHVLCSHLWADFCLRLHGRMINHVAQIPDCEHSATMQCTTCVSCRNCTIRCSGGSSTSNPRSAEDAPRFIAAYRQTFGVSPDAAIWDLKESDGCASC